MGRMKNESGIAEYEIYTSYFHRFLIDVSSEYFAVLSYCLSIEYIYVTGRNKISTTPISVQA